MEATLQGTQALLQHLGLGEEPFGVHYTNTKPEKAFGPKPGVPISRALEEEGKLNMQEVFGCFSCIIGNIWLARKKHCAAYISEEEYGCPGGIFYSAMQKPNVAFIEYYVTTGIPGTPIHGERYLPSPEAMRQFLAQVSPPKAPAKYCVFKPLSQFTEAEQPDFVIFFARPEVLTGLFTLTSFTTGNAESVATPFGAGCTNIVAWPLHYREQGVEKAVLGGFDPSARKFLKTDELTFTVPLTLYRKMLAALPESMFNQQGSWPEVRKKVARSATAWGEDK